VLGEVLKSLIADFEQQTSNSKLEIFHNLLRGSTTTVEDFLQMKIDHQPQLPTHKSDKMLIELAKKYQILN
jgi:hypothetical protein